MCGIAGIFEKAGNSRQPFPIGKMTDAMAHRGPDSDGFFEEEDIALGHRRLSIIDLSNAANQPFYDYTGRYVMVFNGEMYNYQSVKAMLPGYPFRTTSDTEVLLAAFAKWGPSCIQHFMGMFVFAVWDKKLRELTVMRDRFGVKPVYYYYDKKRFLFASEVRGILNSGLVKAAINLDGLNEYFSYQSVGFPFSMIEGIHQLEAGCHITVSENDFKIEKYWTTSDVHVDFDWADKPGVHKKIHNLLSASVERRLISDVPIGAFLSGGIDSSAIVGLMAEVSSSTVNTFNIYFDEEEFDESAYAEMVAKKFKTNHTAIKMQPAHFLDELENALNAMDEPSGDGVNTYVVSKAIRGAGMTVALSGLGGDELFAGYPFFNQFMKFQKAVPFWKGSGIVRQLVAELYPGKSSRDQRIKQILKLQSPSIEYLYPVSRRIIPTDLMATLTKIPWQQTSLEKILLGEKKSLHQLPLLSQVTAAELIGYTQQTLLKDTDQMSMAVSLEVREPFFDHELVSFVLAVPDKLKTPVYPKSLLVESLKPMLPDEIVFRKKKGFSFPWNVWMKKELRGFCDVRIQSMSERSFIHKKELLGYWNRFLKGDPKVRWAEIWLFIVLEHWLQKNNISTE